MPNDPLYQILSTCVFFMVEKLREDRVDIANFNKLKESAKFESSIPVLVSAIEVDWQVVNVLYLRKTGVTDTPEFNDCIKNLLRDDLYKSLLHNQLPPDRQLSDDEVRFYLMEELFRLLEDYQKQVGSLTISRKDFYSVFRKSRKEWKQPRKWIYIAPIEGLSRVGRKLSLGNDIHLCPFSEDIRSRLWRPTSSASNDFSYDKILACDNCLVSSKGTGVVPFDNFEARSRMQTAVTALRLSTDVELGALATISYCLPPHRRRTGVVMMPASSHSLHRRKGDNRSGSILPQEIRAAKRMAIGLNSEISKDKISKLDMALRRFNTAFSRERPADILVDLTIALESSLLQNVNQELSYRLAVRGARLLHSKRRDSKSDFLFFKNMYAIRSSIVHGGKSLIDVESKWKSDNIRTTYDYAREARKYTRLVLAAFVERIINGQNLTDILDDLDTEAYGGKGSSKRIKKE